MPKIRFTNDYIFKTSPAWITYKAGEVHDGDHSFCEKYIRRGVAEYVVDAVTGEVIPDEVPAEGIPTVKRGRKLGNA